MDAKSLVYSRCPTAAVVVRPNIQKYVSLCDCVPLCAFVRIYPCFNGVGSDSAAAVGKIAFQAAPTQDARSDQWSIFICYFQKNRVSGYTNRTRCSQRHQSWKGFVHYSYLYIVSNIYINIYIYNFQLSCSTYTKKMNRHTVTSLHRSFYIHLSRVSGVCSFPILLATWRASSAAWTPCNGWGQRCKLVGWYIRYIPHHKN